MRYVTVFLLAALSANAASDPLGLAVTFTSADGKSHTTSLSNIALYVAKGEAASPFITPGPFTAFWEGNIHADLRGEFYFQAELNGAVKLQINTNVALDATVDEASTPLSKAIGLSKGANRIKVSFTSPGNGDAYLRLSWTEKGTNTMPLPPSVLSHPPVNHDVELGRELFLEFRCNKCHQEIKGAGTGVPELAMDTPSFEGIGTRRNAAWMARWILNPKAERPSAHMPKLAKTPEEAEAMAAFLASQKVEQAVPAISSPDRKAPPPEGKTLYDALLCASCHDPADPSKISLAHVAQKFPAGKLADYLLAPEAHFAWTRMPNFHLSRAEAQTLEKQLAGQAVPAEPLKTADSLVATGRTLIQTRGCLNCHNLQLENKATTVTLGTDWNRGCLASAANAPEFDFSPAQRNALQVFGRTDRASLTHHVPSEFAQRQMRLSNCRACHGQNEGFPPVDILGVKLRPEWSSRFIGGEIAYKPRAETHPRGEPWLFARMPSFKSRATFLADGMAALHGHPAKTPAPPKVDPTLAKDGQKLVGKDGGFSCVSCHAVGSVQATDVFDSEGINLAFSAERLLPQYYRRWVRNPLSIDPQTKMPVYFDEEGRSPLTEILDGDGEKQLTAIWHYLLMGDKMPAPNLGQSQ